jgi:hypothetical protein
MDVPSNAPDMDDVLESVAAAYMAASPDHQDGFLETALVPSGFSAIYVRHIIRDNDGPGMAEFLAKTRDGREFTTVRVVPLRTGG